MPTFSLVLLIFEGPKSKKIGWEGKKKRETFPLLLLHTIRLPLVSSRPFGATLCWDDELLEVFLKLLERSTSATTRALSFIPNVPFKIYCSVQLKKTR